MIDLPASLTDRRMLLAEGRGDNRRSTGDFDQLVNLGALTAAIVIIH
jgi:hypothetical protein